MPSLIWVGIIQYSEGLNRTKHGGKANSLSQHQLRYLDSDQDLTISPPPTFITPILRPSDSERIAPQAFLVLRLAEGISWDFLMREPKASLGQSTS